MAPSKHCVLIGGLNEIGCVSSIDDHIVHLARQKTCCRIKALHIGICNGDAQKDEVEFEDAYRRRGCGVEHARLWSDPERIKNIQFSEQDIIYLSGGNPCAPLVYEEQVPEDLSLRKKIREAYDAGVVVVGNSAGSIMLGRCYTHLEGALEKAKVYKMLNILTNVACFAHFEEYPPFCRDEQEREVTPEEFLQTVHPIIKKKARTKSLYTLGLWTRSALTLSWTGEKGSQTCTARSIGEREIMYMNGNPTPGYVKR